MACYNYRHLKYIHLKSKNTYRFAVEVLVSMVTARLWIVAMLTLARATCRLNAVDSCDLGDLYVWSVVFLTPFAFQRMDQLSMTLMRVLQCHQMDEQNKTYTREQDSIHASNGKLV